MDFYCDALMYFHSGVDTISSAQSYLVTWWRYHGESVRLSDRDSAPGLPQTKRANRLSLAY
jgi:hypothetical protein